MNQDSPETMKIVAANERKLRKEPRTNTEFIAEAQRRREEAQRRPFQIHRASQSLIFSDPFLLFSASLRRGALALISGDFVLLDS